MSTKIIIGVIVVLILIGGGVYFYMNPASSADPAGAAQAANQDQNIPQVQGQDTVVGEGAEATPGTLVSVLYVGRFQDGTIFDSSEQNGNEPLTFVLGTEGLIPGFQIGINGMREGGIRLIAVPPELAYGAADVTDENGTVIIPGNSTLVFEVQLVEVQEVVAETGEEASGEAEGEGQE